MGGRRGAARATLLSPVVLLLAAPRPAVALDDLRTAGTATDLTGPLVAAVALLAWALSAWLLLVAALTLLSRLPGGPGRAAATAARRTAPATLRRLLAVALGAGVLAGGLSAGPAAAATAPASAVAAAAEAVAPDLDRPHLDRPDLDWPDTADRPALDWPTGAAPGGSAPVLGSVGVVGTARPAGEPVVVHPGDSLWELAERRLSEQSGAAPTDAQVAAAWPAWWSANREVVGDDPDLLRPGTVLQPPGPDDGPDRS